MTTYLYSMNAKHACFSLAPGATARDHFYFVLSIRFVENLAFRILSSLIPLLKILPFGGPHSIDFRK